MVPPIEEQIHRRREQQEEERCGAIEAQFNRSKATQGRKVRRNKIMRWIRVGSHALCGDTDLLLMVTEYDYDLSDRLFQEYCEERGVLHVAGEPESRRWHYFLDHAMTKSSYLADPFHQFAQEFESKRYRYTEREMETGWAIVLIGRGKLQDCWELYSRDTTE